MKLLEFKNFRKCLSERGVYFFDDLIYRGLKYGCGILTAYGEDGEIVETSLTMLHVQCPMPSEKDEEELVNIVGEYVKQAHVEYLESQI